MIKRIEVRDWLLFFFFVLGGKEKYSYLRFLLSMSKCSLLKQDPEH